MTQEEKDLLLKDLCARLPYGVKIKYLPDNRLDGIVLPYLHNGLTVLQKGAISYRANIKYIRPFLRPISSMTQKEIDEYDAELDKDMDIVMDGALDKDRHITSDGKHNFSKNFVAYFGNDWLNAHHFDYRGLIEKGLALEAPEGMYKAEELK